MEAEVYLKVLVVVGVDTETGYKAVNHEVHVGALAARPPRERLCWVEKQGLMGQGRHVISTQHQVMLNAHTWKLAY